jgi:hypothetical protein
MKIESFFNILYYKFYILYGVSAINNPSAIAEAGLLNESLFLAAA